MRYALQRVGSWLWLDLDAQITTDGPEWALNSWGVMKATITPELAHAIAEDGILLYDEWSTLVHVETDDTVARRRWTGVVTRSAIKGGAWELQISEFACYPKGVPIDVLIRGVNADPAALLRQVWQAVQGYSNAWLNVDVVGSTPVKLGTNLDDLVAVARATMDARKATLDSLSKSKAAKNAELQDATKTLADDVKEARSQVVAAQAALSALVEAGAPQEQIDDARDTLTARTATRTAVETAYRAETAAARAALATAATDLDTARAQHTAAQEAYQLAVDRARDLGGAWEVKPYNLRDAQAVIGDLVRDGGFDWTTEVDYSETIPSARIRVHHPHAGTLRDDLVFEQGQGGNILSGFDPERDGDDYANAGYGVGAGEGAASVQTSYEEPSHRLRRPTIVEDKSITSAKSMTNAVRAEVERRDGKPHLKTIVVRGTEMTPIGSWSVGDIITPRGRAANIGEFTEKARIISWRMIGDDRAEIRLVPAV